MKKDSASSDTTRRQSRSNVVPLKGEIDLHVSPTVTATLNDVIDKKPERLVVDLTDVMIEMRGAAEKGAEAVFCFRLTLGRVWQRPVAVTLFRNGLKHHGNGVIKAPEYFRFRWPATVRELQVTMAEVTCSGDARSDVIAEISGQMQD